MSEINPTQPEAPAAVLPTEPKKGLGKLAFWLSIGGFVAAIIPGVSFFAWVLILGAFVVSIVALVKKSSKGMAITGLLLSLVSGVIAIVVSLLTALAVVAGAASDSLTTGQDEIQAGIGQTVTTSDDLDLTIDAVKCGDSTFEGAYGTETALGQFCVVNFTLANTGKDSNILLISEFGGLVGDTQVDASSNMGVGGFGTDSMSTVELNPGLTTTGVAVIDIPAGKKLDAVTLGGLRDAIAIANK